MVEGAGEEEATVVTGGVEAAEEVCGLGGGGEGELEGADLLGVAAGLEAVEVTFGGAGAGAFAAAFRSSRLDVRDPTGHG